jgi:hypothetical protein
MILIWFCLGNSHEEKLVLNAAVREVFVNRFVSMFHSFEHFVILSADEEEDLNSSFNTSQSEAAQQNFDKVTYY